LAIVNASTDAGLSITDVTDLDAPVGKGVMGMIENGRIRLGSANFLISVGLDPSAHDTADHPTALEALRARGSRSSCSPVTHPRHRVAAR
jgi:cation transport ATPase